MTFYAIHISRTVYYDEIAAARFHCIRKIMALDTYYSAIDELRNGRACSSVASFACYILIDGMGIVVDFMAFKAICAAIYVLVHLVCLRDVLLT